MKEAAVIVPIMPSAGVRKNSVMPYDLFIEFV